MKRSKSVVPALLDFLFSNWTSLDRKWGESGEVDSILSVRWENRRREVSATCALLLICALAIPASATQTSADNSAKPTTSKTTPKHKTSSSTSSTKSSSKTHTASSKSSSRRKKKSAKVRGQQKIDSERAQAIQEALIRQHYLTGEATGTWNDASEAAMRRYQADNGWQSKTVPDSRALIKLGLGPSKDHLLNPESAMTTVPDAPKSESLPPTSNSPAPVADPPTTSNPTATSTSGPQ